MQMTSGLFVHRTLKNLLKVASPVLVLVLIFSFAMSGTALAADSTPSVKTGGKDESASAPPPAKGVLYALMVGVSKYRDSKIPKLDLADRDAQAFGDFLQTQDKIFKETRVTFLLDEKAIKSEIEKYLYYMLPKAGKDDTVILFLSGHGAFDPMRPKEFLFLPYDSESEYLGTTGVKMSGLEFLKEISAERVLIIADACHAGGFSQMKPKALTPSLELFIREARNSSGRAIISSAKDGQLSWELPDKRNSVFTHNLLEGLKGKADKDHDGVVTLNEAYEYAYNHTKEDTAGRQHPQFEGTVVGAFPLSFVGPKIPESELRKKFLDAAAAGDLETAEKFISYGADVDSRSEDNATALIISARQGHAEIVKLLLSRGAEIDATDNSRSTGLLAAGESGHVEVVGLLVHGGARIDAKDAEGETPLSVAAGNGHVKILELLLDQGADVKSRTNGGDTALTLACAGGHLKAVQLLLNRGADVNAADLEGVSGLIKACRGGHAPVVKLLLEKGAEIKTNTGGDLERQLVIASVRGDDREVKRILEQRVRVDAVTTSGDTALTLASGLENLEVIKLLVQRGANPNFRPPNGVTPLPAAAGRGRTGVVRSLSALGADVHAVDNRGNTALIQASRGGHTDTAKLLLNTNAVINATNKNWRTALIIAAENGHADVVRLLTTRGADVQAKDKDGSTALIQASQNGHADVVKILLGKNAEVNAGNNEGSTALIVAARNGQNPVVKILMAAGANVGARDWEGKTALTVASERGRSEVVDTLKGQQ